MASPVPAEDFAALETEGRNPRTLSLDSLDPQELIALLHSENRTVLDAVELALPAVTRVVEVVSQRLATGGRLFYVGAGTSGRLGVLDASECPPTFGVSPDRVQGIIAGGEAALSRATEATEDDPSTGARDLLARGFTSRDVLVGIAAS